tara:strand:- start:825 stop:1817 length:993 start_codon:yes stop_codon:yes gene_type:complete
MKTKLNKKYVIGVHVMFFEIEMYKEYIDGLINLLDTIENKDNITLDFCFNISEKIEKIDKDKISVDQLIEKFENGIQRLKDIGMNNIKTRIHTNNDDFYFHADYRRDLNYNYCKKVDYVMWGETDSFFPKEAFQAVESLSQYTDSQNIHRYIMSFADRKMWDTSWDPLVHPKFENHVFVDDDKQHLNLNQAKSPLPIEKMNEINAETDEFDFRCIPYPKISGSCLVLSADIIKFGVNIPLCLLYNDDHGLSIMAEKLCGKDFKQFICKNIIHMHARRHPNKRLYVKEEDNPNSFEHMKHDEFKRFKQLSQENIHTLSSNRPNKFHEYKNF